MAKKKWVLVKRWVGVGVWAGFRVGVYLFLNNAVLGLGLGLDMTLTLTLKQPFLKKKDRPRLGVLLTPPPPPQKKYTFIAFVWTDLRISTVLFQRPQFKQHSKPHQEGICQS